MSLQVPFTVRELLRSLDQEREPLDPFEIGSKISEIRRGLADQTADEQSGSWAELVAFQFAPGRGEPWGTYFGPFGSAIRHDGVKVYVPNIKEADGEIVEYWETRAHEVIHPILRARYADVVWDLSEAAGKPKPKPSFAREAIGSYLESVEAQLFKEPAQGAESLIRAMDLSLSLNDSIIVGRVIEEMFIFVDKHADPENENTWAFLFDELLTNKKIQLTDPQRQAIIERLEALLSRCSTPHSEVFSPFAAKSAADRLASFYHKTSRKGDVERVIRKYGQAFEYLAQGASALFAMSWLSPVIDAYRNLGMKHDLRRVQLLYIEKGKSVDQEMRVLSVPIEFSQQEIDDYLDETLAGTKEQCISRIAYQFTPKLQQIRESLQAIIEKHPLLGYISVSRIADGQVVGHAGSIVEDERGRIIVQLSERIANQSGLLGLVLDKMAERHSLCSQDVVEILFRSPLFVESHRGLIQAGFDAYFAGDFIKAIHVLMPQVEECLRNLLAALGEPVNKIAPRSKGLLQQKNLNDILAEPFVINALGEDVATYLLALLADARGLNLRHRLCHGLLASGDCSRAAADALFHVFLVLAAWRVDHGRNE